MKNLKCTELCVECAVMRNAASLMKLLTFLVLLKNCCKTHQAFCTNLTVKQ